MLVHRSNRTEDLVDVLAEIVRRPLSGPAAPECVVVQGRGMERWLSMQLARRLGVWANPDFPFPRRIIERAIAAVLPEEERAGGAPFEPETAMWSIAALLPAHLRRPEFAPIAAYLEGDERDLRRVQLAQRIADTFDHYAVYRPRMVLAWEGGEGAGWQPVLWRALVSRHGAGHLARARAALPRRARRRHGAAGGLPAAHQPVRHLDPAAPLS